MKQLFLSLALACLVGYSDSDAATPPTRLLGGATAVTQQTAEIPITEHATNGWRDDDDTDDDPDKPQGPLQGPPSGLRYIVDARFISQVSLIVAVGNSNYSKLCLYNDDPNQLRCVAIDAPIAPGARLEYHDDLSGIPWRDTETDTRYLLFIPAANTPNPDPDGTIASRWIEALGKAAAVWGNYLEAHPELIAERPATASENDCYAEMRDKGYCEIKGQRPDNPSPDFPREDPEPPPFELPPGGGSPIEDDPKERLAQLSPVAPPCGAMGPIGGMLCSITIFGVRPPPKPPKTDVPVDRGHQYFAPRILCNWQILCNVGQEPRGETGDNDRSAGGLIDASTSGKTQAELHKICEAIHSAELETARNINKAMGGNYRDFLVLEENANKRLYACYRTADKLTDNGQHPAP